ncbi:MAG: LysE family translocator [Halobacteriaceae archaeon]
MVLSIIVGIILGLSLAAPPGPMNAIIAEQSVNKGWRAGFSAGLGAMSADFCFFVLALLGAVTVIQDHPQVQRIMIGFGGVLMLYFAYDALKNVRLTIDSTSSESRGFQKTFILAITNPFQITWWLTAGLGLLEPQSFSLFQVTLPATNGILTIIGFFTGILVWITVFPRLLQAVKQRITMLQKIIAYASALLLGGFGLLFLSTALFSI